MTKFKSTVPKKSKEFQNQTEMSTITQEEYKKISEPFKYTTKSILFQVLCSILFLTPLRFLLSSILIFFLYFFIFVIRSFVNLFQISSATGRQLCLAISRCGIRIVLFCFGVSYIKIEGYFDERARFIIANHVGYLEPFILLLFHDLCYPMNASVYSSPIIKVLLECLDVIYLPSEPREGENQDTVRKKRRKLVMEAADDHTNPPLLIFPEGLRSKTSGDVLMKFNQTAFMSPYYIQPVVIRFTMLGVPDGLNTYAYKGESLFNYLCRLFTMPFSYLSINLLPPTAMGKSEGMEIEKFTDETQLTMANAIGIMAVNKAEREFLSADYVTE